MQTFIIIIHVIASLGLMASVVMQSGKSAGLSGAIAGGAESFFGKKKGLDDLLSKMTMVFAALFLLSALGLSMVG
ncbi:preprotein translocase subunit SecG [Heliobacterium gestii]|uniref:Protein-export membrane protein SecG n=1 Tax=Heliomicrobium gestii TaxID=2699 RepID=A0A845LNG6_HELGE|nr:preprotein translocase subunit SecG [Heliomicrobium gestii]MBM7868232.1 preprotein translocase subunit SecG [Heliomicrobium gestii]MZP44426.1 preprotein translocase subunit SecG [Heliomicrobium gestii]